ncbi:MAG: serpin family protein [Haloferula sp.]
MSLKRFILPAAISPALLMAVSGLAEHSRAAVEAPAIAGITMTELNKIKDIKSDPFTLSGVTIEGGVLKIQVSHSGGHKDHDFTLYSTTNVKTSNPPQVDLFLKHDAHGDRAEALLMKKLDFNLADIPKPAVITVHTDHGDKKTVPYGIQANPFEGAAVQDINPAFTSDLYAQLRESEGNVFFSPYSITEAMAMVHAGAGGNTADEIAQALGIDGDPQTVAQRLQELRKHLMAVANQKDNKLNIANALCVTGMTPKPAYQDIVRQQFGGEIFSGGLDEINGWVKDKTEGNIEKILEQLSPNSACVLLNAVYFKGNWQDSFEARHTHKAPFHLADGKKVDVDMMKRKGTIKVLRDQGFVAVELPYQTRASMVLILPDEADGMAALETNFSEAKLQDLGRRLASSGEEKIELYLPKFKIETEYDLVKPMQNLGIVDAFSSKKSDFKVMYGKTPVAIAQIKHKATLEVDEKGSVATAATAVEIRGRSRRPPTPQIRFDRPFLVMIRDRDSGTNLFMGRINDPSQ